MSALKLRNPRRDGIAIVCEWTVTPLVNAAGEIVAVIAQGRDVTAAARSRAHEEGIHLPRSRTSCARR
jgi:hypothetical protein